MVRQKKFKKKPMLIAGPCAAESEEQIKIAIRNAKKRGLDFVRISLWKPRTKPGFEGLGEKGIKFLIQAAKERVNPATEVLVPEQAKKIIDKVLSENSKTKLLLWIGARNQNHYIQREIARIAAGDKRVFLMVKNQPWSSKEHWEGIIDHVLDGGINKDRLILCHRGYTPNGTNPKGYRNLPEYSMAMEIKEKTGLPMIFDPSHTGGSVTNVIEIAKEALRYDFSGLIAEVHHNPKKALIDAKQQLTWKEFDNLMSRL